jgi:hypothetical protein
VPGSSTDDQGFEGIASSSSLLILRCGLIKDLVASPGEVILCLDVDAPFARWLARREAYSILRVTTSTEQQRAPRRRIPCSEADPENEYDRNIQIADLNMLNAAPAVVKWKKLFGFYADNESEHFSTYTIDTNLITSDET